MGRAKLCARSKDPGQRRDDYKRCPRIAPRRAGGYVSAALSAPLILDIDLDALAANWRWFRGRSHGAETGAAVKADGYGLGASEVTVRLAREGCREFFVTTFAEADALGAVAKGLTVRALHGPRAGDAARPGLVPVLNSPQQIARWREMAPGAPCDVMIDTGMNRLGIGWREFREDLLDGLNLDVLHSHIACADEPDNAMNAAQRERFERIVRTVMPPRASLAGSGAICLGADYVYDMTRPGLGLYGGVPNPAARGALRRVVRPMVEILQVRQVRRGDSAGYGATWRAAEDTRLAALNIGYADGYLRGFSNAGHVLVNGERRPVVGRVSMDLATVDLGSIDAKPGDLVEIDYDLPAAAAASGLSQYELLTALGARYQRDYR